MIRLVFVFLLFCSLHPIALSQQLSDTPCYADLQTFENITGVSDHLSNYPSFIKGKAAWQHFANVHLCKANVVNIKDSVVLHYIVRTAGGLSNLRALYYTNQQTRDEAMRLMKCSCPYWKPANVEGRNITCARRQVFIFNADSVRVMDHPEDPQPKPWYLSDDKTK